MTVSKWHLPAIALLLSACHNPGALFMPKPTIEIKERQHPTQAHQIIMTIENAPGPFALIEGSAQYDVVNHNECGYIDPVSETISRINTHPPIEWKPMGDGRYITTVYTDLMIDEDYYGRGVCRWTFTAANVLLRATGAEAETRFLPGISAEDIENGTSSKLYFWNDRYPRSQMDDFADLGENSPEEFKAELRNELFTITLIPQSAPQ